MESLTAEYALGELLREATHPLVTSESEPSYKYGVRFLDNAEPWLAATVFIELAATFDLTLPAEVLDRFEQGITQFEDDPEFAEQHQEFLATLRARL